VWTSSSSRTSERGGGTREDPGTLTQVGALFSLVPNRTPMSRSLFRERVPIFIKISFTFVKP
jgi:hypothetical protein